MRLPFLAFVLPILCAGAPAQLRHAIADARYVVVARHVGVQPLGNDYFLHRYETRETLGGKAPATFTVVERKRVADLPQPKPGPDRLMCLVDDRTAMELPERYAPFLAPTGYRGEDPVIDDSPGSRAWLELARVLLASEQGRSTGRTTTDLVLLTLRGEGRARIEACETLRERPVLRDAITSVGRDGLLMRAVGETTDVEFKVALASLCAESGQKGVVEAMCIGVQTIEDPRLAEALGRIARHVHGEDAVAVLQPFLRQARGPVRDRLLLAIGATGTDAALESLLQLRRSQGPTAAVDAALRAHGAPAAIEAVEKDRGRPVDADGKR